MRVHCELKYSGHNFDFYETAVWDKLVLRV